MKAFITLVIFCLITGCFAIQLEKINLQSYFEDCVKQEKVSEKDAKRLLSKDFSNPSEAMKCFGTCFFEKIGTLKDGVVLEAAVLEKFAPAYGEEKVKAALAKCEGVKGSDRCDNGFKILKCFEKAKDEVGIV